MNWNWDFRQSSFDKQVLPSAYYTQTYRWTLSKELPPSYVIHKSICELFGQKVTLLWITRLKVSSQSPHLQAITFYIHGGLIHKACTFIMIECVLFWHFTHALVNVYITHRAWSCKSWHLLPSFQPVYSFWTTDSTDIKPVQLCMVQC